MVKYPLLAHLTSLPYSGYARKVFDRSQMKSTVTTEPLLSFDWHQPVGGTRIVHAWLDFEAREDEAPEDWIGPGHSCIVRVEPEGAWRFYDGFKEAVDFRKRLLQTQVEDYEGIAGCAAIYGFLKPPSSTVVLPSGERLIGEPVDLWRIAIYQHRIIDAYHEALVRGDASELKREQMEAEKWVESVTFGYGEYEGIEVLYPDMLGFDRNLLGKLPTDERKGWKMLLKLVNAKLTPVTSTALNRKEGESFLDERIKDLLGFSWVLLAQGLAEGKAPIRCECCARRFPPHPKAKPGHGRFCGDSCRVTQSRRRNKAKALSKEGASPRRIAKRLGVKESLVRVWVRD